MRPSQYLAGLMGDARSIDCDELAALKVCETYAEFRRAHDFSATRLARVGGHPDVKRAVLCKEIGWKWEEDAGGPCRFPDLDAFHKVGEIASGMILRFQLNPIVGMVDLRLVSQVELATWLQTWRNRLTSPLLSEELADRLGAKDWINMAQLQRAVKAASSKEAGGRSLPCSDRFLRDVLKAAQVPSRIEGRTVVYMKSRAVAAVTVRLRGKTVRPSPRRRAEAPDARKRRKTSER